jgi:hypothetical protein
MGKVDTAVNEMFLNLYSVGKHINKKSLFNFDHYMGKVDTAVNEMFLNLYSVGKHINKKSLFNFDL